MGETKYGKYFLKNPWGIKHPGTPDDAPKYIGLGQVNAVEGWDEPLTQVLRPIYYPYEMIPDGHRHAIAEILYFIGGDPMNFEEFGAEVEFTMGRGRTRKPTSSPIPHGCTSRRTCCIAL